METLTIKVKNRERLLFLYKILENYDFVELPKLSENEDQEQTSDFFDSAGIWQNRDISTESIRKVAWGNK